MFSTREFLSCVLVAGLFGLLCVTAGAEGEQVVDLAASRAPAIRYEVAAPRACIMGFAKPAEGRARRQVGAAENFPREDGELKVATGTKVVFCLSRELEGVWYPHSFGELGCSIVLQRRVREAPAEGLGASSEEQEEWVTIGRDGARAIRRGPSIGRAKVSVPVLFRKPGVYKLRVIVRTTATAMYPRIAGAEAVAPIRPRPVIDRDTVYIKVKVVDLPITEIVPDEEPTLEPDANYIIPIPSDIDSDGAQQPRTVVLESPDTDE